MAPQGSTDQSILGLIRAHGGQAGVLLGSTASGASESVFLDTAVTPAPPQGAFPQTMSLLSLSSVTKNAFTLALRHFQSPFPSFLLGPS